MFYERRSVRLRDYDYAQEGMYYVTICTFQRERLFGDITDGVVALSKLGTIAHAIWQSLPNQFAHIDIDEFVIMPNHVHGIITITQYMGGMNPAPTARCISPIQIMGSGSLGEIVRWFKGRTSYECNRVVGAAFMPPMQTRISAIWQRNYYEHVIRDEEDLNRIRQYIRDNPMNWADDELA